MKILITGGTGFIGKNLINLIAKKNKLNILSRKQINKNGFIKGDLMNYDSLAPAFKKMRIVIHLAFSKNYPENLKMTENLIKISKKEKVKKIILLSSMSAKRSHPDDYGKIKREIEKIIRESGLNYTILRPSIVYGKGSTSFDFIIKNIKKIPFFTPIIGNGKYIIMPTHISDVVNIIERCISNRKSDRKEYDLPGGEKIYFVDLVNKLKREINVNKKNIYVPIWICKIIATFFPRIISEENIRNLTENTLADIKDVKRDLGYNPIKFCEGVENGLL